jgi:hypothetical protein
LGIGSQLSFVADKSSAKQGCLTPGTNLRILAPSALIERSVDYTLLLAWNFQSEIIEQQTDYLKQGGAFIVPLPELRIICFDRVQSKIVSLAP